MQDYNKNNTFIKNAVFKMFLFSYQLICPFFL